MQPPPNQPYCLQVCMYLNSSRASRFRTQKHNVLYFVNSSVTVMAAVQNTQLRTPSARRRRRRHLTSKGWRKKKTRKETHIPARHQLNRLPRTISADIVYIKNVAQSANTILPMKINTTFQHILSSHNKHISLILKKKT